MSLRVQSNSDVITKLEPTTPRQLTEVSQKSAALDLEKKHNAKQRLDVDHDLSEYEDATLENVETAVNAINGAMEYVNRGLRFSIHEGTQRVMVRVVDVLTDEVIKELPPEAVLDTAARIREMIGLLVDERA